MPSMALSCSARMAGIAALAVCSPAARRLAAAPRPPSLAPAPVRRLNSTVRVSDPSRRNTAVLLLQSSEIRLKNLVPRSSVILRILAAVEADGAWGAIAIVLTVS